MNVALDRLRTSLPLIKPQKSEPLLEYDANIVDDATNLSHSFYTGESTLLKTRRLWGNSKQTLGSDLLSCIIGASVRRKYDTMEETEADQTQAEQSGTTSSNSNIDVPEGSDGDNVEATKETEDQFIPWRPILCNWDR